MSQREHRRRPSRGLSLVEVMLCASLSSLLLTSVAFAFKSGFNSYKDAQQRGHLVNAARSGLYQIATDIRAADAVAPYDPTGSVCTNENNQFAAQTVPGSPKPGLQTAGGSGVLGVQILKTHADTRDPTASPTNPIIITYWLDNSSQTLFVTRKAGSATPVQFSVCGFVQSLQMYIQPQYVPPNPQTHTAANVICRRVVMVMTLANKDSAGNRILSDGGQDMALTLTDAAIPRKIFPGI